MWINTPPNPVSLSVHNSDDRFAVRNVYCIGRNYAAHAEEMGFKADRENPFYFLKPASSLTQESRINYPPGTKDLHHEVELVLALGSGGRDLSAAQAEAAILGYACGLDLTRRDLQIQNRDQGRPWEVGKVFDDAAPISQLVLKQPTPLADTTKIELTVNGQTRQSGTLGQMIHGAVELVQYLSTLQTLDSGDLIFTGTPAGVAALQPGDQLVGKIEGLPPLEVSLNA